MTVRIPEKFFDCFAAVGDVLDLPSKAVIYTQNDFTGSVYLIVEGRLRAYCQTAKGDELTLEVFGVGRIFGDGSFLQGSKRSVTIETVTDARVVRCPMERLIPMCHESQELMTLMFQHLSATGDYLAHQLLRATRYDSRQKVADFLLEETERRNQTGPRRSLPYSHADLADSVALNRVTVTRVIDDFKSRGWVDTDYGRVIVLDPSALAGILP